MYGARNVIFVNSTFDSHLADI